MDGMGIATLLTFCWLNTPPKTPLFVNGDLGWGHNMDLLLGSEFLLNFQNHRIYGNPFFT